MRICLVSREFAPFFGAGIGTYAALMARTWIRAGHEVTLITGPEATPTPMPGLEVCLLEDRDVAGDLGFVARSHAVMSRIDAFATRHFDVIEFADYFAEGVMTLRGRRQFKTPAGARLICRLHTPASVCRDVNEETWRDVTQFLLDHHEWDALAEADALLSPSHALLKIVSDRLGPIEGQTRAVVPYPFDLDSVADLGDGRTIFPRPTVLCFGRLEKRKGVDLLVDAASAVLA
ncbi:MAG: glycosyltransferase family 4 protein, partial [Phycisphaerales bacterium]|nr:glycosyltransferase family 4 protein [Phycisphaerales bacterium]